ncbi:conserved hypothetical protein [Prochlorococcus marinus str. MIT 9515]|uniref:Thioredoxin domain-containing protein n=1 Tax=Prochlorococcus marinus (strain MIT 9515) TaxID=167542 RepID=A2BUR4_PROM5|nr:thioredoxin family protein [Prochlorococcus marinus]ABM71525.1 conserved hypothetical protein [Prochlorococcus marinus str. MIT 9515]
MVKTNSMYLELGTQLPFFEMINVNSSNQEKYNFSRLDNRHLLLMFICAHCPFVKYIENHISVLSADIEDQVQTIAISSNDIVTHPSDSPENLRNQAKLQGWTFPYLYDERQVFAKKLKAACTPDFYLFSNAGNKKFPLFYHGQLDSSRPSNDIPITGEDLRAAVQELNKNSNYPNPQQPSLGCNIKWTPGGEPDWFK